MMGAQTGTIYVPEGPPTIIAIPGRCSDSLSKYSAPRPSLPAELWTLTWQRLPLAGRVAVSQTCHDWRALAISAAWLWTAVDFSISNISDSSHLDPLVECAPWKPLWSGITPGFQFLDCAFSRSGGRPLDVDAVVKPQPVQLGPNAPLVDCGAGRAIAILTNHVHRLAHLRLRVQVAETATDILSRLNPFPALVSMSIEIEGHEDGRQLYPSAFYIGAEPLQATMLSELSATPSVFH
ncbi:hypothetical protein BKA62DRAFT_54972 [Auriculariales sp. MPI-PUGE-AT-0066]|nr:hypothetical protein BKA62DRAFT_54972 [Auriculariales sp. MPI-PUGE-AT-0066]